MPVIDSENTIIEVGATAEGTFAQIDNLTGYTATHGREAETRTRVFGREDAYVKPGERSSTYDINGLYDPADTDGQNVLRDAYESGEDVYLRVLHDGEAGYLQGVKVTEYSDSATADGEYVEVSFSATSTTGKTTVTPAP
jgi:hypothetical protein